MRFTITLILVLFGLHTFAATTTGAAKATVQSPNMAATSLISTSLVPQQNDNSSYGYEMEIDLKINGNKMMENSKLSVLNGGTVAVTQETNSGTFFLEATPTENKQKSVLMKFVVGTIDANGKKTIISTPQINAVENENAKISIGGENVKAPELLSLSVTAKRKLMN